MARRPGPRSRAGTVRRSRASTHADRAAAPFPIAVRRATAADLALLVRHRRGMWTDIGGRSPRVLDQADPVYRRWARREMEAGRFIGLVAEDRSGRAAASGVLWIAPAHPRPGVFARLTAPYVMSMYTEPEFRRRGAATRIVRWMVRWTRDRGYPRIYLNASTMGRPVYARLGFVPGNEMRLDLHPTRSRRPARTGGRR